LNNINGQVPFNQEYVNNYGNSNFKTNVTSNRLNSVNNLNNGFDAMDSTTSVKPTTTTLLDSVNNNTTNNALVTAATTTTTTMTTATVTSIPTAALKPAKPNVKTTKSVLTGSKMVTRSVHQNGKIAHHHHSHPHLTPQQQHQQQLLLQQQRYQLQQFQQQYHIQSSHQQQEQQQAQNFGQFLSEASNMHPYFQNELLRDVQLGANNDALSEYQSLLLKDSHANANNRQDSSDDRLIPLEIERLQLEPEEEVDELNEQELPISRSSRRIFKGPVAPIPDVNNLAKSFYWNMVPISPMVYVTPTPPTTRLNDSESKYSSGDDEGREVLSPTVETSLNISQFLIPDLEMRETDPPVNTPVPILAPPPAAPVSMTTTANQNSTPFPILAPPPALRSTVNQIPAPEPVTFALPMQKKRSQMHQSQPQTHSASINKNLTSTSTSGSTPAIKTEPFSTTSTASQIQNRTILHSRSRSSSKSSLEGFSMNLPAEYGIGDEGRNGSNMNPSGTFSKPRAPSLNINVSMTLMEEPEADYIDPAVAFGLRADYNNHHHNSYQTRSQSHDNLPTMMDSSSCSSSAFSPCAHVCSHSHEEQVEGRPKSSSFTHQLPEHNNSNNHHVDSRRAKPQLKHQSHNRSMSLPEEPDFLDIIQDQKPKMPITNPKGLTLQTQSSNQQNQKQTKSTFSYPLHPSQNPFLFSTPDMRFNSFPSSTSTSPASSVASSAASSPHSSVPSSPTSPTLPSLPYPTLPNPSIPSLQSLSLDSDPQPPLESLPNTNVSASNPNMPKTMNHPAKITNAAANNNNNNITAAASSNERVKRAGLAATAPPNPLSQSTTPKTQQSSQKQSPNILANNNSLPPLNGVTNVKKSNSNNSLSDLASTASLSSSSSTNSLAGSLAEQPTTNTKMHHHRAMIVENVNLPPEVLKNPSSLCWTCFGDSNTLFAGRKQPLIVCFTCKAAYHSSCLQWTPRMSSKIMGEYVPWQCHNCKACSFCKTKGDVLQTVFCDDCDRSFHIKCLIPPLSQIPETEWSCPYCLFVPQSKRRKRIN